MFARENLRNMTVSLVLTILVVGTALAFAFS